MAQKNVVSPPSSGSGSGVCKDTQQLFDDFKALLDGAEAPPGEKDEWIAANAQAIANEEIFKGKNADACAERRNLQMAKETYDTYASLLNCQVTTLCKDIEQAQETVKRKTEAAAKVKADFEKVIEKLKALKAKMANMRALAGVFSSDVANSCNTEAKKILNDKLPNIDKLTYPCYDPGFTDALVLVQTICDEILVTENATDQAVESTVLAAGIYASTNVSSIKQHTDDLKKKCDELKTDVETNLKNTETTVKNTQKALTEALGSLSAAEAEWRRNLTVVAGIEETLADLNALGDPNAPTLIDLYEKQKCSQN